MADLKRLAVQRKAERFEAAGLIDQAKKAKAQLAELESAPEEDELSEFHLGGGWYQIGDEKVQGKDAAREALEAG